MRAISVRMKLVVPFTIPWTRSMWAAASVSRHHADGGHHAGHGALEAQLHPVRAGGLEDLLAELREQLLVGGHHVPPGRQRAQHVLARRLGAAHQLDHQVAALEQVVEVARGCG